MPLPQIVLPTPVEVPPALPPPSGTFASAYIVGFNVSTSGKDAKAQSLTIEFRPYDYEKAVVDWSRDHTMLLRVDNIWTEAARVPLFAQAMGLVTHVSGLLLHERHLMTTLAQKEGEERRMTMAEYVTWQRAVQVAEDAEEIPPDDPGPSPTLVALRAEITELKAALAAHRTTMGIT